MKYIKTFYCIFKLLYMRSNAVIFSRITKHLLMPWPAMYNYILVYAYIISHSTYIYIYIETNDDSCGKSCTKTSEVFINNKVIANNISIEVMQWIITRFNTIISINQIPHRQNIILDISQICGQDHLTS